MYECENCNAIKNIFKSNSLNIIVRLILHKRKGKLADIRRW